MLAKEAQLSPVSPVSQLEGKPASPPTDKACHFLMGCRPDSLLRFDSVCSLCHLAAKKRDREANTPASFVCLRFAVMFCVLMCDAKPR